MSDAAGSQPPACSETNSALHVPAGATCWVCCESEPALIHTGCGCRGSAGFAHVRCVAGAARHKSDTWRMCPTCQQLFTGAFEVAMARQRVELQSDKPAEDEERLEALEALAVANRAADPAETLRVYEELLDVRRRAAMADPHAVTSHSNRQLIAALGRVASAHQEMGDYTSALPLYEEELHHWHEIGTDESGELTLDEAALVCMNNLGALYRQMDDNFNARPLLESALDARRQVLGDDHMHTLSSISNLGSLLNEVGDHKLGLELLKEAAGTARRVLGPGHPKTQSLTQEFEHWNVDLIGWTVRAVGMVVGLAGRPDLNGSIVAVLRFDSEKGRYICRPRGGKNLALKPPNLYLNTGTAVIIQGLQQAPEYNGRRGLLYTDPESSVQESIPVDRHTIRVMGRDKVMRLRPDCFRVEGVSTVTPVDSGYTMNVASAGRNAF